MSEEARAESTFSLTDPIICAEITTASQVVLSVCSRDNLDNSISVSLSEQQANEAADKLWNAADDLKNRRSNKTWQRLLRREH